MRDDKRRIEKLEGELRPSELISLWLSRLSNSTRQQSISNRRWENGKAVLLSISLLIRQVRGIRLHRVGCWTKASAQKFLTG